MGRGHAGLGRAELKPAVPSVGLVLCRGGSHALCLSESGVGLVLAHVGPEPTVSLSRCRYHARGSSLSWSSTRGALGSAGSRQQAAG